MGNLTKNFDFNFLIAGVVVSLILAFSGMNQMLIQKNVENNELQVEIYKSGSGFGYRILSEEDIIVQQDFIPAIENNQPFCDREDADRIASYVLQKMQQGSNPAISLSELRELEISFNCAE